jgi:hypothetical protein
VEKRNPNLDQEDPIGKKVAIRKKPHVTVAALKVCIPHK